MAKYQTKLFIRLRDKKKKSERQLAMLAIGAKSLPRFRKGILVHMTFNLDAEGKVRINKSNIEKFMSNKKWSKVWMFIFLFFFSFILFFF